MPRLLLVGLSHEMLVLARRLGHEVPAVVDPAANGADFHGLEIHRDDETAAQGEFDGIVIGIDDPADRKRVLEFYAEAGLAAVNLIDGAIGDGSETGPGLVVQHMAHISVDCRMGIGVRVNVGANVMHDVRLGDFVTVAPGAVILARVTVEELSYIGANATILPGVEIGRACRVGAGAVVTKDVADGATVKGMPAS